MPCPCNNEISQLLNQIKTQLLNIFDWQNVFVYCLECRISNQCPEIIVTPISVHGCVGKTVKRPGIYIVVGNPKLGTQCQQILQQQQKPTCTNTKSTIIHIGSSNDLLKRFAYFILELKYDFGGNLHSTAYRIRQAILKAYTSQNQTCLYIIGFPLDLQKSPSEVEGCFQKAFKQEYKSNPCCIGKTARCNQEFFSQIQDIAKEVLKDIDLTFQNCISQC